MLGASQSVSAHAGYNVPDLGAGSRELKFTVHSVGCKVKDVPLAGGLT